MRAAGLLRIAAAAGAFLLLTAHSPYRQWDAYRRARLVIVASFEEEEAVRLGLRLAAAVAERVPETRAMLSRARDTNDLFRLVASRQIDVALVGEADAHAAVVGAQGWGGGAGIPLRSLARVGPYLLVCRDDFPPANAYRIAEAVADGWRQIAGPGGSLAGPRPEGSSRLAVHAGAGEYWADHAPKPPHR